MEQNSPAVGAQVEPSVMQRAWVDCAAFPVTSDHYADRYCEQGMSLRDYFAAKTMNGLLAQSMGTAFGSDPKHVAEYAYAMADAMMAVRAA